MSEQPAGIRCTSCSAQLPPDQGRSRCPYCGAAQDPAPEQPYAGEEPSQQPEVPPGRDYSDGFEDEAAARSRQIKKIVWILVIVALILAGFYFYRGCGCFGFRGYGSHGYRSTGGRYGGGGGYRYGK